jgi:hypothetical protein
LTEKEFDGVDFSEYRFRADCLTESRAQAYKERMVAAAYTAWQISGLHGLKMSWGKYQERLGLLEKEKRSEDEIRVTTEIAMKILKRLKR